MPNPSKEIAPVVPLLVLASLRLRKKAKGTHKKQPIPWAIHWIPTDKKKTGKGFSNSQLWVWGKKQKQKITNKTKKIHKYTVWLGQQSTPTAPGNMIPLHESMLWSSLSYPHNELNPKIQLQGLGSNEPSPIQTFNNQQNQKRRQVRYNKQQGLYGMGQS